MKRYKRKNYASFTVSDLKSKFSVLLKKINLQKVKLFIKRKPMTSFLFSLGFLLFLILLSSFLSRPKPVTETKQSLPKKVQVYKISNIPRVSFQAQIEKSGVVKIVSQTSGIIETINVKEGQFLGRGGNLINISSTYAGGNTASIQTSIAAKQYKLVTDTYDTQKDIIGKQRDVAQENNDNSNQLRDIANKSLDETRSLINLNQEIIDTLNENLLNLESTNTNDVNRTAILQTKQAISQVQAGQNQIRSALRAAEYQGSADNPPQKLADLQKDITLKQLDIQEKSLELNKEISRLQLSLAFIGESFFHPVAPFAGTVEKIFVRQGQNVTPGTPLLSFNGQNKSLSALVKVPGDLVGSVSKTEDSNLYIGSKIIKQKPDFVSSEATDGQLYSVIYSLAEEDLPGIADGSYIKIEIPIDYPESKKTIPYIPLDAVYQTQEQETVYVVRNNKAEAQQVKLGNVLGEFVEVLSGLNEGDRVIIDRNVIKGDSVKIIN
ncbi:MAG: hypothetical protein M1524_01265 [Patescibacteria group bacterium]|nr:hypothetical protein [Patescibacteria group bacterium]